MNEYDDLKKLFNAITTKKKVGHAFLFNVDDSYDTSLAISFIKEILKNDVVDADTRDLQYEKFSYQLDNNTFPDLMIIKSFDKVIKKEQILNIKSEMREKSINSGKQFYIIEYAENLNTFRQQKKTHRALKEGNLRFITPYEFFFENEKNN